MASGPERPVAEEARTLELGLVAAVTSTTTAMNT
jgi:hypothetical protein